MFKKKKKRKRVKWANLEKIRLNFCESSPVEAVLETQSVLRVDERGDGFPLLRQHLKHLQDRRRDG